MRAVFAGCKSGCGVTLLSDSSQTDFYCGCHWNNVNAPVAAPSSKASSLNDLKDDFKILNTHIDQSEAVINTLQKQLTDKSAFASAVPKLRAELHARLTG